MRIGTPARCAFVSFDWPGSSPTTRPVVFDETDSVSSKTTGLVVGEEPGASKLTKAQRSGVPILAEADLLELLGR